MSGDGVHGYQADFLDKVGKGADGTLTTFPNTTAAPGYEPFVARYKQRFGGKEPGPYAIFSYVSANILLQAIADSASTDGTVVAKAIHAGKYQTPLGEMEFDAKGDVKSGETGAYVIWVVRDGHHVVYGAR